MPVNAVKAKEYVCDGCHTLIAVVPEGDDEPEGYYGRGTVLIHKGGGTHTTEWYACSVNCIKDAIISTLIW